MTADPGISVLIPALDAEAGLPAVLDSLEPGRREGLIAEVLLCDGGSKDQTARVARDRGARVLSAGRANRGRQLATAAAAAGADWLLFLHADTRLAPGWVGAAERFMSVPRNARRAGYFRLELDDPAPQARRIEAVANWRARTLGLPYGDQGLLITKSLYGSLGGYRPLALMEDVDFVRRLGRRRLVMLESEAITSAARYRRGGWLLRPLRNLGILALYFAGLPPAWLKRLYG
ncbi:MAG: TIGR04283 family arsenosugar biosynthesis glycosyltransferase [Kiloniellales bacterium]|nr:TIGR04283 family arsenosugar biosynthesis glycosyltransferase [Kiloniellales bacterium]